jgi:hypothetical protein
MRATAYRYAYRSFALARAFSSIARSRAGALDLAGQFGE